MNLALVLGEKQGATLKPKLQDMRDNVNIDYFDTVTDLLDFIKKRNVTYDRILVLSIKITGQLGIDLYNYWYSNNCLTNIVVMCKSDTDGEIAKWVDDTFRRNGTCAMVITSTTIKTVAEAVFESIDSLNANYGLPMEQDDMLGADFEIDTTPQVTEPEIEVEPVVNEIVQEEHPKHEEKPKKGGLFSKFKNKKNNKGQAIPNVEPDNDTVIETTLPTNEDFSFEQSTDTVSECSENNFSYEETSTQGDFVFDTEPYNENIQTESFDTGFDTEDEEPSSNDDFSSFDVDFDSDNDSNRDFENNDFSSDFDTSDFDTTTVDEKPTQSEVSSFDFDSGFDYDSEAEIQNQETNEESSSPEVYQEPTSYFEEEIIEEVNNSTNTFEPEELEVNVDLGDISTVPVRKVEDLDTSAVVTDDEVMPTVKAAPAPAQPPQPQASESEPKIIVREVIRNKATDYKILESVLNGRSNRVIVVTGDRGSGITCTCLNIAKTLSKHIHVLYVDCDIENHGLLNYIDYNEFCNYQESHHNGIKLCKSERAFQQCAMRFDDNLDILTSDFSCDATNENLTVASEVVASLVNEYGVVIVDCPMDKLEYIEELVISSVSIVCIEESKRGFMNALCQFSISKLTNRYKRHLVNKGVMFVTKLQPDFDLNRLVRHIKATVGDEPVDLMDLEVIPFNGKLTDAILEKVLEG